MVVIERGEDGGNEGEEGELDVSDPEVCFGVFEDHLEVDACEPGREACCGHGAEAFEGGHDVGVERGRVVCAADGGLAVVGVCGRGGGLDLDDGDAEGEEDEGDPFGGAEAFAEEDDGEGCGGEDLHLVGDLEGGDGEV